VLVVSDAAASVAGTFTKNVMKSPAVKWSETVCAGGSARAVFVNSGNANACTGDQGVVDTRVTAELVAAGLDSVPDEVCVCSTGVIGEPLPMDSIRSGVKECLETLSIGGGPDAAEAIMTTDTVPKELAVEVALDSGPVRIGAIGKGAGMIAPNMATMICVIATDAAVAPGDLGNLLRSAIGVSFNQISVDNDMSTSDSVICLANGAAGGEVLSAGMQDLDAFAEGLTGLCREMAKRLVRDGEGATKFVEIAVAGAETDEDAKTIARAIAHSMLCKTAFFGEDPNWGRFACAAGYSGVSFDPARLAMWIDDLQLVERGQAAGYDEEAAVACMRRPEFTIRVEVGDGAGSAVFWTSDLSRDYIHINADYRS
jgi:glutamate N-acetyltransferase/amino-acid N-acetyltransferase